MSMTDPIADLLTRIRNAQMARKPDVSVSFFELEDGAGQGAEGRRLRRRFPHRERRRQATLTIELKYYEGRPVIDRLERVSRPGLRIYRSKNELPKIQGGLGTAIVSTPKGVMTDKQARAIGQGGEVLCIVA